MVKGTGVFMPRSYDEVTAGRAEGQQHVNRTVAPIAQHLGSRATSSQSCCPGHDGDTGANHSTARGDKTANSLRTIPGASRYRRSCSLPLCTSELCEDAAAWQSLSHSYSSSRGDHAMASGSPFGLGHLAATAANQPSKGAGITATSSSKLFTQELGRCVPASHCQDHRQSHGAQHSSRRPSSASAAEAPSYSRQTAQPCSGLDYPGSLGSPTGYHMPLASAGGHRCTAAAAGAMALAAGHQGPPAAAAASGSSSSSSFALQPQNSIGWHTGPPQGPSATGTALTDPFLSTGKRVGMHPTVLQFGQHTTLGYSAPMQPEHQQQLLLPPSPAAAVEPGSLPDTLMLLQQQLAAAHMSDTCSIDDAAAASGTLFSDWNGALTSSSNSLDRSCMAIGDTHAAFYQQQRQQQQQGFSIAQNPVSVAGSAGASYGLSSLFDSSCGSLPDLPHQAQTQGQTQQEESYAALASSSIGAAGGFYGSSPQGAFNAEHDVGALAAGIAQQKIEQMAVLEMLQQKLQQEVVTLLPYI